MVLALLIVLCLQESPATRQATPASYASPLAWKELATGCDSRFATGAVVDAERGRVLVYAGETNTKGQFGLTNDLWAYRCKDDRWEKVATSGDPPARAYHSVALDTKRQAMWLFGGASYDFKGTDDLWKLDLATNAWSQVAPQGEKPGGRFDAGFTYDPKRDQLVLHSGSKAFGDTAWKDVWTFDVEKSAWTKKKAEAPDRWQMAEVLDPEDDLLIVHGGFDGGSRVHDHTWIYRLADDKWTDAGKGFKATDAHAAVWDPLARAMIVYGGTAPAKVGLDQVWSFDPKAKKWSELKAKGTTPGGRAYHVLVWDPSAKGLWAFGGTQNQFSDEPCANAAWSLKLHE